MSTSIQQFDTLPMIEPEADPGSDAYLVRECLEGNEQAWYSLIERYKRLIYSIPYKYRAAPEDCADIFQSVCLDLYSDLGKLRKVESLKSWIISVTIHKCFHWKRQQRTNVELDAMEQEPAEATAVAPPDLLIEVEQEQLVREAIRTLKPQCAEMIRMLFYEEPPLPYNEVAQRLGLATGSIGFTRSRCLKQLEKALRESGFLAITVPPSHRENELADSPRVGRSVSGAVRPV
jgi:RNA polymerase sigma factor (sigma-70 family)